MDPKFFNNQDEFRRWLEENHETQKELWVGYYKVNTGKPSMTWSESVDQALCFGWIDGLRKSIDDESYCIRFTPRKPGSTWSAVNISKVEDMMKKGLMFPAGISAFNLRKEVNISWYSYENELREFPEEIRELFKANTVAWDYFSAQAPSYKKMIIHWVMSAKREETRFSRFNKVIVESENHRRIYG